MSFMQNMFNHKDKKNVSTDVKLPKSAYGFVHQYTLIDPKKLLINEEVFALRRKIPVAHETDKQNDGWHVSAQLHTEVMLPFIRALRATKSEYIAPVPMRTVSVIELDQDKYIYILPSITVPHAVDIHIIFDKDDENTWPFYMTPEKRKAVLEQIKIHSR